MKFQDTSIHCLKVKKLEMFVKHYAPNCMLVPKLAVCMIHLFNSNAVKFNFLTKLSVASVLTSIQNQNVSFFAGELEMK